MNVSRLTVCLVAALACSEAAAFRLGQLTVHSRLGEVLAARIELYGVSAADAAALRPEIKPELGTPAGDPAHRVARDLGVTVERDTNGPYLALSSGAPVEHAGVRFRLRVRAADSTSIARYRLDPEPAVAALEPAVRPPRRAATRPAAAGAAATAFTDGTYGPVRPGQSLWRILRELGRDGDAALIDAVVARNPQAFVAGDADRLRVGAMLAIPETGAAASSVAVDLETELETELAALRSARAATAARLDALGARFAAIRARHAAQAQASAATPTPAGAPLVAAAHEAAPAVAQPARAAPPSAAAPAAPAALETAATAAPAWSLSKWLGLGTGALISALGAIGAIAYLRRRRRQRAAHRAAVADDRQLIEQVMRKAEKRLQLEGEVAERRARNGRGKNRNGNGSGSAASRTAAPAPVPDPLVEIDHRIAHGSYAEAEALLTEVIAAAPANYRAKLRLAEIYYLDERRDEFAAMAAELQDRHRAEIGDDGWQRIMRMGKVLTPDRLPFSGPVALDREA